ncbi:CNN1 protein, partial [Hypocryptadius cinnamomeus]|nr:CNN1 protein [Hypocryptadius cinnamomeus]
RVPVSPVTVPVSPQLAQKYDPQHERELRAWIEGTTGRRIGDNFMDGLKDGVILCELINKLQPGSVPKVNEPVQNWHKVRGNPKTGAGSGRVPHHLGQVRGRFGAAPAVPQAKTKGNNVGLGVKYAEKQQRRFQPEKLREGRNIIGLQMGTNKFASQQGMTAYGTRRHLYDPKLGTDQPLDQATISLQMGTNKGASQVG